MALRSSRRGRESGAILWHSLAFRRRAEAGELLERLDDVAATRCVRR
jgi:hypothetical protein